MNFEFWGRKIGQVVKSNEKLKVIDLQVLQFDMLFNFPNRVELAPPAEFEIMIFEARIEIESPILIFCLIFRAKSVLTIFYLSNTVDIEIEIETFIEIVILNDPS